MEMMGSIESDLVLRPSGEAEKNVPPMYRDGSMDPMDFAAFDVPSSLLTPVMTHKAMEHMEHRSIAMLNC